MVFDCVNRLRLWIVAFLLFLAPACTKSPEEGSRVNFLLLNDVIEPVDQVVSTDSLLDFYPSSTNADVYIEGRLSLKFPPDIQGKYGVDLSDGSFYLLKSGTDSIIVGGKISLTDSSVDFLPNYDLLPNTSYSVFFDIDYRKNPRNIKFPKKRLRFLAKFSTRGHTEYSIGRNATTVAAFPRDGTKTVQMGNNIYSYGGWTPDPLLTFNDVYRSSGGLSPWEHLKDAPWFPRHTFGLGKIDSTLYIFGGDAFNDSFDVWRSGDGENFEVVPQVDGGNPGRRILYGSLVHNNKLMVVGGQRSVELNQGLDDVWSSADGSAWKKLSSGNTFLGKNIAGSVASFNGEIWVVGGGYYKHPDSRIQWSSEVYSSPDGINWQRHPDGPWAGRQFADLCVWNNCLWMICGAQGHNLREIWFMRRDGSWEYVPPPAQFEARHATGVTVYNDQLVVTNGNLHNDCWVIKRK